MLAINGSLANGKLLLTRKIKRFPIIYAIFVQRNFFQVNEHMSELEDDKMPFTVKLAENFLLIVLKCNEIIIFITFFHFVCHRKTFKSTLFSVFNKYIFI